MESSKCFQGESPSPFRFLAALIPPCAQTECERFTGTMENRSTLAPISAILMTAASPARPPPTTMIRGFAIFRYGFFMKCSSDANPAPHNATPSAEHSTPEIFCERGPTVIPHFEQNSHTPYAKWKQAATMPTA